MKTTKDKRGNVTIVLSTDEAKHLGNFIIEAVDVMHAVMGIRSGNSDMTKREAQAVGNIVLRRGFELERSADELYEIGEELERLTGEKVAATVRK